jgi:hypothetical protein
MIYYGRPFRSSPIRLDKGEKHLDLAILSMFDLLEKHTYIDRKSAEKLFWDRIEVLNAGFMILQPEAEPERTAEEVLNAKDFLNDYAIDDLNVFGRHEEYYSLDGLLEEYASLRVTEALKNK